MVVQSMDEISIPSFSSAPGRLFLRIAIWHEARHQRRMKRLAMAEIPAELRQDIGLDGGAPLRRKQPSGRSFAPPDRAASDRSEGWFWKG